MIKNILAVLTGIITAIIVFSLFEYISYSIFPFPTGLNKDDEAAMAVHIKTLPVGALILVLAGWMIGSIIAGIVVRLISKSNKSRIASITGAILTLSAVLTMYTFPHPIWFMIAGILVFIPSTLFGFRLTGRRSVNLAETKPITG